MYIPANRVYRGQAGGEIWVPSPPDGLDFWFRDDFDRDGLDGWTLDNGASFSPTPIDPYDAGFVAGDVRISVNDYRKSMVMLQSAQGATHQLHRALPAAIPTNLLLVAGLRYFTTDSGNVFGQNEIGLVLGQTAGGIVDANNRVELYGLHYAFGTSLLPLGRAFVGGVKTTASDLRTGLGIDQETLGYSTVAIHKLGTAYHLWLASISGTWNYMPNRTAGQANVGVPFAPGGTIDRFGIEWNSRNSPGPTVFGIDFIWAFETDDMVFI